MCKRYNDIPAINNSLLSGFTTRKIPLPEDAFLFGTLVHKIALEPDTVSEEDIKHPKYKDACHLAIGYNSHPLIKVIKGSGCETFCEQPAYRLVDLEPILGYDSLIGVPAKCRYDQLVREANICIDLKTTSCKTQQQVNKSFSNYNYDRAAFWYMTIGGLRTMVFLFLSKLNHKTFNVVVRRDDVHFKAGEIKARQKLQKLVNRGHMDEYRENYTRWLEKQ